MREIKFRAWDFLSKRMIAWGDIFHLPAWEIFPGTPEQRTFQVMQYAGLKDCNGVEVYEGDIVTILQTDDESFVRTHEVVMFNGSWCYQKLYENYEIERLGSLFTFGRSNTGLTVIGNNYENPELLAEGVE